MAVQVTVWPRGARRSRTSGPLGIAVGTTAKRRGTALFATDIGRLVNVTASTRYEDGFGGHDLASWTIAPLGGYAGGLMRPGDHVRITKGGGTVWEGEFSETRPGSDGTVEMHARGYGYSLFDCDAIHWSSSGAVSYPTNRLTGGSPPSSYYAWDYAVAEFGLPITQVVGTMPTGAFGATDVAEQPIKLGTLLTAMLREQSKRWAVWGRSLVIAPDTEAPVWRYDSPDGLIGVADTDYRTHVGVWYVAVAPGTSAADWSLEWAVDDAGLSRFDVATEVVDCRGLGLMTSGRAQTLADTMLAQVRGRFVLSGSFTVGPRSGFASLAGGAADIAFVRAGRAMRLTNVRTSQGNLLPDAEAAMIGKTEWSWTAEGEERLTITPMGAVPRSLSEILRAPSADPTEAVAGAA